MWISENVPSVDKERVRPSFFHPNSTPVNVFYIKHKQINQI